MSPYTLSTENESSQKDTAGYVSILFTNTNVYRRTIDSAPIIGSGKEDYSIKIGCMGRSDCIAKIDSIHILISSKKNTVKSCEKTIYARIIINPDSTAYGESKKNEADIYDIDHTGKCVTHLGNSYKIKKSIFEILNNRPIQEW